MENTTEGSEHGVTGVNQQQEIGSQLPPPYSTDPSVSDFLPISYYDPNVPNSTLNVFEETLNNEDRFQLTPMGRVNSTGNIFVQFQNTAQQPIMSSKTVPPVQNISTGMDDSARAGHVIQITNTSSGQLLMTGKRTGESIIISAGDQIIGVVEGMFNTSLFTTGALGEILFYSTRSANSSEFTLMSNGGVALARIEKVRNDSADVSITLFDSLNVDSRTKALLIFTGYLMVRLALQKSVAIIGNIFLSLLLVLSIRTGSYFA
ncbi:uncharacterized protein LOC119072796 [Bradysia coprophila]|uniref:uncharacterized protein LOC119072796 n=1 Tax=Bradysia coprophila TaxID=38358 RepID=UPI00187D81D0|nr:uncharacterized protein LOC119072796 [Bradysia coprophila]